MPSEVTLREVRDADLPTFFEHQLDPDAIHMAAFTSPDRDPSDRDAFEAHWAKMRSDDTVIPRTVLFDGQIAGVVAKFEREGVPEVMYWIDKAHWGKGIATKALAGLLEVVKVRPINAGLAKDNVASMKVLQKCGFSITEHKRSFAKSRGKEIDEVIMTLA